jgi:hypothetical protein
MSPNGEESHPLGSNQHMARKHKGSVRHNYVVAPYKFPTPKQLVRADGVSAAAFTMPAHLLSVHAGPDGITFRSLGRGGVIRQTTQAW